MNEFTTRIKSHHDFNAKKLQWKWTVKAFTTQKQLKQQKTKNVNVKTMLIPRPHVTHLF